MRWSWMPAAILLAGSTAVSGQERAGTLTMTITPVMQAGEVTALDVAYTLRDGGDGAGFGLMAPIVYPGVTGVADRMTGIVVTDRRGPVPFTIRDEAAVPGGFPYFRHWTAGRAVQFPVTVRYRSGVQPIGSPGGPPFGIRAVGGGFAGAGSGFLLLPKDGSYGEARVTWNLSAMPKGSSAVTTFGDGNFTLKGRPGALMQGWYLAGPGGRYAAADASGGFSAAWLGTPTFDAPRDMAVAARGHAFLGSYFPHLKGEARYRVFIRFLDTPPFGGATALGNSFMLSRGPLRAGEERTAPLSTLFHEMIHMWVGGIDAPQGVSSWFSEGLTTYYEYLLPLRGGFKTPDQFLADANRLSEWYFTSKARNWSAEQITKVGFGDEEVRHTPYRRSAMYFYDLDARIRAKSGGKRNLESILFPLFVAREGGMRFDHAKWIELVTAELGQDEQGRFERLILQGSDTLDPQPTMFGPCYTREPTTFSHDGRQVAGYRWVRAAGVPDSVCKG
jgi:hypothetical protein